MKKRYYILIILLIIFGGVYIYFKKNIETSTTCYDGYWSNMYFMKSDFISKLNSINTTECNYSSQKGFMSTFLFGLDEVAHTDHECSNVEYSIKDNDARYKVNESDFLKFINTKELIKITVPDMDMIHYSIHDLTLNKNYIIGVKNGKCDLLEN